MSIGALKEYRVEVVSGRQVVDGDEKDYQIIPDERRIVVADGSGLEHMAGSVLAAAIEIGADDYAGDLPAESMPMPSRIVPLASDIDLL